jgi:hypothetical protein
MLTFHTLRAKSASCAAHDGVFGLQSSQYKPVIPAASGDVARCTLVCAPCAEVLLHGRDKNKNTFLLKDCGIGKFSGTKPGCAAFTVTLVPSSRLANSVVNKMFANFVAQ